MLIGISSSSFDWINFITHRLKLVSQCFRDFIQFHVVILNLFLHFFVDTMQDFDPDLFNLFMHLTKDFSFDYAQLFIEVFLNLLVCLSDHFWKMLDFAHPLVTVIIICIAFIFDQVDSLLFTFFTVAKWKQDTQFFQKWQFILSLILLSVHYHFVIAVSQNCNQCI